MFLEASSTLPRWVRERSALPTELDSWTDGQSNQRRRSGPFTSGGGSGVAGNSGVGRTNVRRDGREGAEDIWSERVRADFEPGNSSTPFLSSEGPGDRCSLAGRRLERRLPLCLSAVPPPPGGVLHLSAAVHVGRARSRRLPPTW